MSASSSLVVSAPYTVAIFRPPRCIGPASDRRAAYMDWLKARSFRRLGSISATLRVDADDELEEEQR